MKTITQYLQHTFKEWKPDKEAILLAILRENREVSLRDLATILKDGGSTRGLIKRLEMRKIIKTRTAECGKCKMVSLYEKNNRRRQRMASGHS